MNITSLLKPEVKALFTEAIKSELYASNLYKHIANQLQRLGLFGAQKYYLKESMEELTHYQKLVDYLNDVGDVAEIPMIPAMVDKIGNIGDALDISYETELALMKQYQKFYDRAEDEYEDCVTATFIIDYLQIQRKSVGEYGDLISRLKLNPTDLFEFDEYMGELAEK